MHLGLMYAALVATGAISPDGRSVPASNPEADDRNHNRNGQVMPGVVAALAAEETGVSPELEEPAGCPAEATIPAIAF
ncbi:hypothetical protein [Tautonia marina]|uniref:hypothetical protein n=1 Tax=Tautonia marina TaxID=2653855 RepID=UPI0012609D80|nr:hypothetical protein [Tautonia marina]